MRIALVLLAACAAPASVPAPPVAPAPAPRAVPAVAAATFDFGAWPAGTVRGTLENGFAYAIVPATHAMPPAVGLAIHAGRAQAPVALPDVADGLRVLVDLRARGLRVAVDDAWTMVRALPGDAAIANLRFALDGPLDGAAAADPVAAAFARFRATWYRADRATLVVVTAQPPTTFAEVRAAIGRAFASLPRPAAPAPRPAPAPPPPATHPEVTRGTSPHTHAIELRAPVVDPLAAAGQRSRAIDDILADALRTRLAQRQRDELVPVGRGQLELTMPLREHALDPLDTLATELARLARHGVTADELRAGAAAAADAARRAAAGVQDPLDRVRGEPLWTAESAAAYARLVAGISLADVAAAARTRLAPGALTIAVAAREPRDPAAIARLFERAMAAPPEELPPWPARASHARLLAAPPTAPAGAIVREVPHGAATVYELANGARAVVHPTPAATATIHAVAPGGWLGHPTDPPGPRAATMMLAHGWLGPRGEPLARAIAAERGVELAIDYDARAHAVTATALELEDALQAIHLAFGDLHPAASREADLAGPAWERVRGRAVPATTRAAAIADRDRDPARAAALLGERLANVGQTTFVIDLPATATDPRALVAAYLATLPAGPREPLPPAPPVERFAGTLTTSPLDCGYQETGVRAPQRPADPLRALRDAEALAAAVRARARISEAGLPVLVAAGTDLAARVRDVAAAAPAPTAAAPADSPVIEERYLLTALRAGLDPLAGLDAYDHRADAAPALAAVARTFTESMTVVAHPDPQAACAARHPTGLTDL